MKKIGIVTLYDDINIGNKLQNYAVQTFFTNLGYQCETIRHWEMAHFSIKKRIKNGLIALLGVPQKRAKIIRLQEKRKEGFRDFSNKYLRLGPEIHFKRIPDDLQDKYDYFVTGSDQVWHNWTNSTKEIEYFFLMFAKEYQRLTIAPSFGKNNIENEFCDVYKNGILGIPYITCRENQGAKMIKSLTGKDTTVILDPTMLIDTNEWLKIEKKPNAFAGKKYILIYSLGEMSQEVTQYITMVADKNHFEIIDIFNEEVEKYYFATPDEFIYYIRHAEIVITDSFHATVFSILFHRNFIVFDRNTISMGNMSSRLDTLLNIFQLQGRKYGLVDLDQLFISDFSMVDSILEQERAKSKKVYNDTFEILDRVKKQEEKQE